MTTAAPTIEPLVSLTEASRQLGVPRATLQNLIDCGRLRCFRIGRGMRRVRLSDVQPMIEEQPAVKASSGKRAKVS
jgi:excisionase family DNA binding protein